MLAAPRSARPATARAFADSRASCDSSGLRPFALSVTDVCIYEDARRLFQDALDLDASPAAAEGLRRVDNVEAVLCPDHAACGTLVIRVTPTAEIFVDDRSLGEATSLVLRVPAGRHRVRLETANWRFPRALKVAGGETSELVVDLERDGFPR